MFFFSSGSSEPRTARNTSPHFANTCGLSVFSEAGILFANLIRQYKGSKAQSPFMETESKMVGTRGRGEGNVGLSV